jgi:secretion/DNA translocation related TadE-like protein
MTTGREAMRADLAEVPSLTSRPGRRPGDEGSVTVWVLCAGLVIVLIAAGIAVTGAAVVARHRAQAAADLAALAGAMRAWDGESAACERAADVGTANDARLVACRLDGFDVIVTVEVAPSLLGHAGVARVSARAGPAMAVARAPPAASRTRRRQRGVGPV